MKLLAIWVIIFSTLSLYASPDLLERYCQCEEGEDYRWDLNLFESGLFLERIATYSTRKECLTHQTFEPECVERWVIKSKSDGV